jgi:hypothetical protein
MAPTQTPLHPLQSEQTNQSTWQILACTPFFTVVHTGEMGESELLTLLGLERLKVLGQACLPQESVAALMTSPQMPDLTNFCVEDVAQVANCT